MASIYSRQVLMTTPSTAKLNTPVSRRIALNGLVTLLATNASPLWAQAKPVVDIWKDPNCGCCNDWLTHIQAHGFALGQVHHVSNAERARLGMPPQFASCHTALIGGYLVEGHVPAADIHRLLRTRPAALGLSVPGMPMGSPGMDGPVYGGRQDPYRVALVQRNGQATVFASHPA